MANNCLVEKLKEAVSNNNLPHFNEVVFEYVSGSGVNIRALEAGKLVLDTLNGGTITLNGSSLTLPYTIPDTYTRTYALSANGKFVIRNKENLKEFIINDTSSYNINIIDFGYCTNLDKFEFTRCTGVAGDVKALHESLLLTRLIVGGSTGITGSIDKLIQYQAINGSPKQVTVRGNGVVTLEGAILANSVYRYITIVSNSQYSVSENSDFSGGNTYNYINGEWVKQE